MSERHEHKEVRVPRVVEWALTRPVWRTTDIGWADRSRMVFKPAKADGVWVLSTLGILHGLTGLTLVTSDKIPTTKEQT